MNANHYLDEEIQRRGNETAYWTKRVDEFKIVVTKLNEGYQGIKSKTKNPAQTKKELNKLLEDACCVLKPGPFASQEEMDFVMKKPKTKQKPYMDFETYTIYKQQMENSLSYDPMFTTGQDEIIATTKAQLQVKKYEAIKEKTYLKHYAKKSGIYLNSIGPQLKALNTEEKVGKAASAFTGIASGVSKFDSASNKTGADKALTIASGVADICSSFAEFLPPPASLVTGMVSNVIGIFISTPSTQEVIKEEMAKQKDFINEKFKKVNRK